MRLRIGQDAFLNAFKSNFVNEGTRQFSLTDKLLETNMGNEM